MTSLSHVHKCVFIHIPKCGGTTIRRYLFRCASASPHLISHIPYPRTPHIINMHPEYFRFTFVRNPYDRFVSYYLHGMRLQQKYSFHFYGNLRECAEFTAGILERENTDCGRKAFLKWTKAHCWRQKNFLPEHNPETYRGVRRTDDKPLSFIGRLENFEEDFMHVQKILHLPRIFVRHQNASENRGHYSEYYDAAARRRVEELYAEDLEILDYDYEQKGVVRSLPPLYDLKKAEQCAPEFSRRERLILFLRAIYFRTLWALRSALPAPWWESLPGRWKKRLSPALWLKTG